jgi:hypothetical protein
MTNPNRVVAVATAVVALALGILPTVADMDWSSTAGVMTSLVVILGVVYKWLEGWQRHEEQIAIVTPPVIPLDEGDPGVLPPPMKA